MISRWTAKKAEAIELRRKGDSIGSIEKALGIPRSTLSGWFRAVPLTEKQRAVLKQRMERGLIRARIVAVKWHNAQKNARMKSAEETAQATLQKIPRDSEILELALAFLYLGEGSKKNSTSMGSSDIRIARFFVKSLQRVYGVHTESIKCYLHLRADQNPAKLERYWAHQLNLPLANFGKASIDKRSEGRPTYPHYKGVCLISCGRVEIQRRLMYIANGFCDTILADSH